MYIYNIYINKKCLKNFYKSSRIQKKLPKLNDQQFEYTQMKINNHFLICGGTGTGKTNALYSYLLETSKLRVLMPFQRTFRKSLRRFEERVADPSENL